VSETTTSDVAQLAARLEQLEADNRSLRAAMATLMGRAGPPSAVDGERPVSRRSLIRLGGMAAAGAGLAAGASIVGARPAAAAAGGAVIQGQSNDAGSSSTEVRSTITGATLQGTNTASGTGIYGVRGAASGQSGSGGVVGDSQGGDGVVGLSSTGTGVRGVTTNGTGVSGASTNAYGVQGTGGAGGVVGFAQSAGSKGVMGQGAAVGTEGQALDSDGIGVRGDVGGNGGSSAPQGLGVQGRARTNTEALSGTRHPPGVGSVGVHGSNDGLGAGVWGDSASATGVVGVGWDFGVHGSSYPGNPAGIGVYGDGSAVGVRGNSISGTGVYGYSNAPSQVAGLSGGVVGDTDVSGRAGVAGLAKVGTNSSGVIGIYSGYSRDGATAVAGIAAVLGETNSDSNPAVAGFGKLTTAVYGQLGPWSGLTKPAAVVGDTDHSVFSAVSALNKTGIGLFAHGGRAPLLLDPAPSAGAPTSGDHRRGELFMDSTGSLWICTTDGTPGSWVRNTTGGDGSTVTVLAPSRILDTRSATPVGAGSANERVVQVTGLAGIPATAAGVALNLTITQPSADGGFVTLYPDGTSRPTASNINFNHGQTIANFALVKLGTGGRIRIYNQSGTTDVLLDVAGYLA
jgi:hypothetical protein